MNLMLKITQQQIRKHWFLGRHLESVLPPSPLAQDCHHEQVLTPSFLSNKRHRSCCTPCPHCHCCSHSWPLLPLVRDEIPNFPFAVPFQIPSFNVIVKQSTMLPIVSTCICEKERESKLCEVL